MQPDIQNSPAYSHVQRRHGVILVLSNRLDYLTTFASALELPSPELILALLSSVVLFSSLLVLLLLAVSASKLRTLPHSQKVIRFEMTLKIHCLNTSLAMNLAVIIMSSLFVVSVSIMFNWVLVMALQTVLLPKRAFNSIEQRVFIC